MKFRNLIIICLLIVGIFSTHYSFAQDNTTNPPNSAKTDCNDNIDNDGDGKIDFKGGIKVDGTKVTKDPECLNAQTRSESPVGAPISKDIVRIKINNPLKVDSISGAINLFMSAVLRIAIPFIVIFFIWSGVSFVLAQGNAEKIKTAKNMFWYTIIGTLLILGAWVITNAIIGTVNSITG